MKKTLMILGALALVLSMMQFASADGASGNMNISVNVTDNNQANCIAPVIYMDHTARLWQPNDQTIYTASEYGTEVDRDSKGFYDGNGKSIIGYEVPLRQNYVFAGETLKYFIIVQDGNGAADINDLRLVLNITNQTSMLPQAGTEVGRCAEVPDFTDMDAFISDSGNPIGLYDSKTMKSYVCTLIVQSEASWNTVMDIGFRARDSGAGCVGNAANVINMTQSDWINFNPSLSVGLSGGINFGSVSPGSTALSNTIYIRNNAEANSGVVMDMYIASSDYFTDPSNPTAICGDGNGIKYDNFGYYATKGSMNSGLNDNSFSMLGEFDGMAIGDSCVAELDEFTPMPSYSGEISDMCRIINHDLQGSLLAQGSEMSMTFKLDVPQKCNGYFTNGQFYIVGRVV